MAVTQPPPEGEGLEAPGLLRYNSPLAQVSLLGLICFCCPGMFNALSGLGGGGQLDHTTADNANTALYACFAVFGILGGGAHNLLGPRTTLLLGALTYPLYAASFLYYNHRPGSQAFPVAAGALLGAGAGLLWAAQGAIMTSYPPPNRRGTYISLFWCLFNLGGVLGGLLPFSFNYHRGNDAASVNDGTYIAFMAFMLLGAALTLLVLPPSKIVRDDGTRATRVTYSSPATEGAEIILLFANWKMLLVLPTAWASNFFYTYQFNNVNGLLFTLRTKGLNNVFYWGAQMLGSAGIGYFLDFGFASRRKRGLVGVAAVAVLGTAIWGGGLANQLRYTDGKWPELIDFKGGRRYAGPFLLYFSYGLLDAMFQSLIYWIIGALANDSQILSRYVGFYKGVQSAGAAVAWQLDTHKTSLISQLVVNWGLMTVSYPLLALLVFLAVKDEDNSISSVEDGKEKDSKLSAPTSFH
ncbi:UNC93-like protein 1 [Phragmites australis]|uniref:UNC93-like protein 1 n=1 Tax=Phragmites australis TaxID=29695 RepID=UPI002D7947FA|nr:UNC93-like protein 1 [Phragmites australis]